MTARVSTAPKDFLEFVKNNPSVDSIVFSSEKSVCVQEINEKNRDKINQIFNSVVKEFGKRVKTGDTFTLVATAMDGGVEVINEIWSVGSRNLRNDFIEEKK